MTRVTEALQQHHGRCDELFSAAENAAYSGDWATCQEMLQRFRHDLESHFAAEESILFPAFEDASGIRSGPTQMMRIEHEQMREILRHLVRAREQRDAESFGGAAETLLVLMGQHNMKEQNILYPMCDRILAVQNESLIAALHGELEGKPWAVNNM